MLIRGTRHSSSSSPDSLIGVRHHTFIASPPPSGATIHCWLIIMILSAKIHGQVQGTVCRLIVEERKRIKNTEVSPGKVQIGQELSGDPEDDERGPDRPTLQLACRLYVACVVT